MENKEFCIVSDGANGIRKVTLNRPAVKNAITPMMYKQLTKILEESGKNENVRMLVITGSGDFFTSGNDMRLSMDGSEDVDMGSTLMAVKIFLDALITFPKLLVAIVNGPAVGIGLTMLGLCDMVYASDKAYFYAPFSAIGFVAEGCSTYTFPRIMGTSKAGDVLYLGYKMNSTEAKECGLISKVYKHDSVDEIWNYLNKIATLSIEAIIETKSVLRKWNKEILLKVNAEEIERIQQLWQNPNVLERLLSFSLRKNKL